MHLCYVNQGKQKIKIMIHLIKPTTKEVANIQLNRIACVNNPFIKGAAREINGFEVAISEGKIICKKCLSLYNSKYKIA